MTPDREELGRLVRKEWVAWAREQDHPKHSWLVPWAGLSEPDREVDRRIGERMYAEGAAAERARIATSLRRFKHEPFALMYADAIEESAELRALGGPS